MNDVAQVRPGDLFCVTYDPKEDVRFGLFQRILAWGIRNAERMNDYDGKAKYTHVGIITDERGSTFEALWRYRDETLFETYRGCEVLIGRHEDMTLERFELSMAGLRRDYAGKLYPAWKFPLFLFAPRVLKWMPGKPVCSEIGAKLWHDAACRHVDHWRGLTPSYVADMIRRWRCIQKVFEGRLSGRR
jgi:hypothetical protein